MRTETATGVGVLYKKVFLKILQNLQENTQTQACNFIKKETMVLVFSYEFCEIFKNTFFTEHLRATASMWIIPDHKILTFIVSQSSLHC